ncbi:MAG TPA: hypothetical protein ENJ09_08335 [Planctomycetes bacterium]|nr:hypothetical protein [Planctomycetota bacterium]
MVSSIGQGFQLAVVQADWDAAGHSDPTAWLEVIGELGGVVFAALVLVLVTRAFLRRRLYRAESMLDSGDRERVRAAIAEAEGNTVGEILPVVLERSDRHPAASWISAVLFVLLGSALLGAWLPFHRPYLLLPIQFLMGAIGYGIAELLPDFKRLFVRESRATEMAQEQAFQEFYSNGLHRTEEATGVLLFVSLFERRVIVLGDEGINAKVEPELWEKSTEIVLERIAAGNLADGLVAGIGEIGGVLAEHFPWREGDRNELSDRLVVRPE